MKDGTPSQVTGRYVEFQVAVLRALPRNIDPDVALGWTQNVESLARVLREALMPDEKLKLVVSKVEPTSNVFRITCEGSYKTSELVMRGRYACSNDWITDERFPLQKHAPIGRTIELVSFDHNSALEEVLAEFSNRGLERPTYEDALYFGIEYPNEPRKHPIVFLHEPVQASPLGRGHVLVLNEHVDKRLLLLVWFGAWWYRSCVFAAVRSNPAN